MNRPRFLALLFLLAASCGAIWSWSRGQGQIAFPAQEEASMREVASLPAPEAQDPLRGEEIGSAPKAFLQPERVDPSVAEAKKALLPFDDWANQFLAAKPEQKTAMIHSGVTLARERQAAFLHLIREEPEAALAHAVPWLIRQDLPAEVVGLLEERVNARADVRTYMGTPAPGGTPVATVRYAETADGRSYQIHATGEERQLMLNQSRRSVIGVAMKSAEGKSQLALSTRRVEPLPVGFRVPAGATVQSFCPVSGKEAADETTLTQPLTETTPAVAAEGEIVYLCDGSHTTVYEQQLIYGEGTNGGPQPLNGALPHATTVSQGMLKVLYIPMTFLDQNATPATEATCYAVMKQVSDYYTAQSFGKLTVLTTVTPPVRLPHTEAWYIAKDSAVDGLGLEHSDARAAVRAMGYDTNAFNTIVVRLNGGPRATGGWGGGNSVWTYYDDAGIVAHEIGHTFGLAHANFWDTAGASTIGSGASQEYGDSYDVMGGGGVPKGHYNIWAKQNLGWLKPEHLWTVTASGTYRIYAHDQNTLDPQRRYGLRVTKDAQRTYYVETRQLRDADSNQQWLKNGAILEWRWSAKGGNNLLLDTTPSSPNGKQDGMLVLGKTWSDLEAGLHFTPVSVTPAPAGGQKFVEMVVNVGPFPGNAAPALTVNPSGTTVATNTAVTFTAVASDADGDALAYFWTFGDGVIYPNAAQITRTFSSAGTYALTCTASDMKGGTSTKTVVVTVGTPGNFTVSGQVTLNGVPAANVPVSNESKDALTDDQGNYTLAGLGTGTYTITPRAYGYTFTGTSVTVGPNQTGINFDGAPGVLLSMAAQVPSCQEGVAGPGIFRLSRSGDVTAALTVQVQAPQGTAAAGDYALAPAISSNTLTIPAGAAFLDVTVTPVNDGALEGPETVTLQVVPDAAYIIAGAGEATVTIGDDDTPLPLVSLKVARPYTTEGDATPASFIISRAGGGTATLNVSYTVTGTATNGTDYTTLSGVATIAAGALSTTINVASLQDTANEGNETVTLTLANNAAYLVNGAANAPTATINDDDLQIITVTTTDANAAETSSGTPNPGTFLISRSGSTVQPLTLYYALSGTAQHGVDYEILPGFVKIPAGSTTANITITPIADSLGEGSENVILQMGSLGSGYTLSSINTNTVTIADNPADKPYVEVTTRDGMTVESGDTGRFRFTATGGSAAFTVNYTVSGTATSGVDYTALSGSVTIAAGTSPRTADVTITPVQDGAPEDLETIVVTITPSANYSIWSPSDSAMMWLRDDEAPTVFVDAHSGTPTEAGTASSFYLSRVGSTTGDLLVNYTMSGTATNGSDYTLLSGTATIPGGAAGVDVPITPIQDALAEGTETIVMSLAPGSYSRTPESALLYLTDDETPAPKVQFATTGTSGSESVGAVNIPVTLSQAAAGDVTVEYYATTGTTSTTTTSATGRTAPYWLRVVRAGNTFTSYHSTDGVTWAQQGAAQTIAIPTNTYLVGLGVCSYNSGALCSAVIDNVSVTGLDAGATQGAAVGTNVGTVGLNGSFSQNGGTWSISGAGQDVDGTSDHFYYVNWTVSNSANCTLTARVLSLTNTNSSAMAGVMIRENVASYPNNVRFAQSVITAANGLAQHYRTTTATPSANSFSTPFALPYWVRLTRAGDTITAFRSADGVSWSQHSQTTLAFSATVYAGLAVTSASDGNLATGVFDNVSITGGGGFSSRDIGQLTAAGSYSVAGGTHTVVGSGAGLAGSNDEFQFAWRNLDGDFAVTARVVSLTNTNSAARAGVMIRESFDTGARHATMAFRPGGTADFLVRASGLSTATGSNADYDLPSGMLTFTPGQTTHSIPLTIRNDVLREPGERLVIKLRNASGAAFGAITEFVYAISDDDGGLVQPLYVGFSETSGSGPESQSPAPLLVALSEPGTAAVSVNYSVTGGTAESPEDYLISAGTLTFAAGETVKTIPNTVVNDAIPELNETITLTLTAPSGAVLNSNTTYTYTITNDDGSPTVTIASPTADAVNVPTGAGLVLEATIANLPGTVTSTWTKVSGPGVVTFTDPNTLHSGAQFGTVGTYILRVTSVSGELSAQDELTVDYGTVRQTFAANVIGTATPAPAMSFATGAYTLSGGGDGIPSTGQPDNAAFFALPVTGNVSITARVVSIQNVDGSNSRAGVMIRETLDGAAASAFVGLTSLNNGRSIFRTTLGGSSVNPNGTTLAFPYWVRMTRSGNVFTAEVAPDTSGVPGTFSAYGSQTIAMNSAAFVGLAVASGNNGTAGTAVMDRLTISQTLTNVGPSVNAGIDRTIGSLDTTLAGVVSDDGLTNPVTSTWTMVSGSGAVEFGNPTLPASTVAFAEPGTYVLRLTANDGAVKTFDDVSITVDLPTISVVETDSSASEYGNNTGTFTLTRSGPTTAALSVSVALSGTAVEGVDFASVGNTVTIPIGATSATVTITPTADSVVETNEGVTLTIQPSSGYALGTASGMVSISDPPIDQWRVAKFDAEAGNSALAGDLADPDGDGVANLVEYALGLEPKIPDTAVVSLDWETIGANRYLRGTVARNAAAVDVSLTFESSDRVGNGAVWSSAGTTVEVNTATTLRARDNTPANGVSHRLLRIKVSRP